MHPNADQRLAETLIERYNLAPPVPIDELLADEADVEWCDWPFECDGMVVGLGQLRPTVFLRKGTNPRRERFTMAHEYGHIQMSWHVDARHCHTDPLRDLSPPATVRGPDQERQANRFASELLVPSRFLWSFLEGYSTPVPEMLAELSRADVSASAGIIALARALLPGYAFFIPNLSNPVRSTGTYVPNDLRELDKAAIASGRTKHQGQWVTWYQLADAERGAPAQVDNRTRREITDGVIARVWPDDDLDTRRRKLSGFVGGVTSKLDVGEAELWGILRLRFGQDPDYRPVLDDKDGDLYLAGVVRGILDNRAAKRRRSKGDK